MTKEEKFRQANPDTNYYIWENKNPKNKITGDCVVRALSSVLELPYEQILFDLAKINIEKGYMINSRECFYAYLKQKGFVRYKQPKNNLTGKRISGRNFCRMLPDIQKQNTQTDLSHIFCNIGRQHVTAIINYKIHDTWNCSDRFIGVWWAKPQNIK